MDKLPIIDILSLFEEDKAKRLASCELVGKALRDLGFLYITNHGIDRNLQRKVMENVRKFFSLPLEKKMEIAQPEDCVRGYIPFGKEQTDNKVDAKEGMCLLPDVEFPLNEGPLKLLRGPNPWPKREDLPEFQDILLEYVKQMNKLGHTLMSALAVSLGLSEDCFKKKVTSSPFTELGFFHYPPNKKPAKENDLQWAVGEHTDYGWLTLLMQDDTGGLQVKTSDGHWIDAAPLPDSFVVNACDMLEIWTNGNCRSSVHRVEAPAKDRQSVVVFFGPHFDCEISPLPLANTSNVEFERKKAELKEKIQFPVHYGKYVAKKFAKSYSQKICK